MVFIRTAVTVWKRRMDASLQPSRYLGSAAKVFPLVAGRGRFRRARWLVALTMSGLSSVAQAQTGTLKLMLVPGHIRALKFAPATRVGQKCSDDIIPEPGWFFE